MATAPSEGLVDPQATKETNALLANLKQIAPKAVLFGHQDDLAYGVQWREEPGRSDVKEVAGSYPALYGWDVGDLEHPEAEANLDGVNFDRMRDWIREAYRRGGVITISWHMDNPVSGGDSWDTTRAVEHLLPGGSHHDQYKAHLDRFARFAKSLKVGAWRWLGFGERIPVIFRPFHEMTGSWFWWGGRHTTPEQYKTLWRFTVEYLRDEKDVHNLLYAYSTDVFDSEAAYLRYYPGDAFVDILGFDDYHSIQTDSTRETLVRRLQTVVRLAEERGKIAALTEAGVEAIPDPQWWTATLLPALKADSLTRRIAYVQVWRNANAATDRVDHFYAPHPGHPSAPDFVRFRDDPFVLFEDELPDMYSWPRRQQEHMQASL